MQVDICKNCNKAMDCFQSWHFTCDTCGLVGRDIYETPETDYKYVFGCDSDGKRNVPRANMPGKRRLTHPVSNFRDVFLQFCGQSNGRVPRALLDKVRESIDCRSVDAYYQVRQLMKENRSWRRYYKDIFKVIYACGGVFPTEATRHWARIRVEYDSLCDYFQRTQTIRSSMFHTWSMLEFILKHLQCESYYRLPEVNDQKSHKKIKTFLEDFQVQVLGNRLGMDMLRQVYQKEGIWLT